MQTKAPAWLLARPKEFESPVFRLGYHICFHNIFGKVFDASNSRELEHLNYICMDNAYIQAELQKYSAPSISSDCLEKDYAVRICRELIARRA